MTNTETTWHISREDIGFSKTHFSDGIKSLIFLEILTVVCLLILSYISKGQWSFVLYYLKENILTILYTIGFLLQLLKKYVLGEFYLII